MSRKKQKERNQEKKVVFRTLSVSICVQREENQYFYGKVKLGGS